MPDAFEIFDPNLHHDAVGCWIVDLERRLVYWPKGLGSAEAGAIEWGLHAIPLDRAMRNVDAADRETVRRFFADILARRPVDAIEFTQRTSWGVEMRLHMDGRRIGSGSDTRVVGFVKVIHGHRHHERLAESLRGVVEALFSTVTCGLVVMDETLAIRNANRNALELFGAMAGPDEVHDDWMDVIEAAWPASARRRLLSVIADAAPASGTFSLGGLGGKRMSWRAMPWRGVTGEVTGLVVAVDCRRFIRSADLAERMTLMMNGRPVGLSDVADRDEAEEPEAELAPRGRDDTAAAHHAVLEWVKNPILLISIGSGEVVFANRAARELFRLTVDSRAFAANLPELSGFGTALDGEVSVDGTLLHLMLGARVGRMVDYDPDLLFVEYHDLPLPHAHPAAAVAARGDTAAAQRPANRRSLRSGGRRGEN